MVLPKLQQIFFAMSNPKRMEIYELCLKEKLNITQISNRISQSYKSTLNNLRILEEAEMIKRTKEVKKVSQESTISSIPFKPQSVYHKVYQEWKKEQEQTYAVLTTLKKDLKPLTIKKH